MSDHVTRRQFVAGSAAAAFGLAAGWHAPTIVRAAADDQWGDLTGRFVYDGDAPAREKKTVDKDVECCGKFDIRDETYMVGKDGGLANVFIYVRDRRVDIHPELEEKVADKVTLDNRDCIFMPHCMSIWYPKQKFYTVNSDPVSQTVTFSPIGDPSVNKVLPVGGDYTHQFKLKQSIPVPIKCVYHPWEGAYILPRDNPYVAISAPDGTFKIPKLPVGELEFQVWHEAVGYLATPKWTRGRFKMAVQGGANDLGTIKLAPALLEKKRP